MYRFVLSLCGSVSRLGHAGASDLTSDHSIKTLLRADARSAPTHIVSLWLGQMYLSYLRDRSNNCYLLIQVPNEDDSVI